MVVRPTKNPDSWDPGKVEQTLPASEIDFRRATYVTPPASNVRTADGFQPSDGLPTDAAARAIALAARAAAERKKLEILKRYQTSAAATGVSRGKFIDPGVADVQDQSRFGRTKPLRYRELVAIAQREGISIQQAKERVARARAATSDLKEQYRKRSAYFGDASGNYDPLLQNAYDIQYAQTQAGQNAAIEAYTGAIRKQTFGRLQDRRTAAFKAQTELTRMGAKEILAARVDLLQQNSGLPDNNPELTAYMANLKDLLDDPLAYFKHPDEIIAGQKILYEVIQQDKASHPGGLAGALQDVVNAPVLGAGLRALGVPIEQLIMQPYYAGAHARDEGGGFGRQWNSSLSSVPGLGFLAGGVSAQDRSKTNSYEKRAKLGIESFGEAHTPGGSNFWSGLTDAIFQVGTDPLNAVTFGLGDLAKVGAVSDEVAVRGLARSEGYGFLRTSMSSPDRLRRVMEEAAAKGLPEEAAKAAREAVAQRVAEVTSNARLRFIEGTKRGRNLTAAAERAIEANLDTAALKKAIPGLDDVAAQRIVDATSQADAVAAFKMAFASGEYKPSIVVRRQLLGSLTDRGFDLPGGVGLGPKVVRDSDGLWDVVTKARRRARPEEVRAVSRVTSGSSEALYNTVQAGLQRAGIRFDDLYDKVAERVMGLSTEERLGQAYEAVADNAGLSDLYERTFKRTQKRVTKSLNKADAKTGLARTGKGALEDWSRLVNSNEFEAWLKQMEVVAELSSGKYGKEAAAQVAAEATFSLKRAERSTHALIEEAVRNTGLGLPTTVGDEVVSGLPSPVGELRSTTSPLTYPDATAGGVQRLAIYGDGRFVSKGQYFKDEPGLLGFIDYTPSWRGDETHIHYMATAPGERSKGIARRLLDELYSSTDQNIDWGKVSSNESGYLWGEYKKKFPDRGNYGKVDYDTKQVAAFVKSKPPWKASPSTAVKPGLKTGLGVLTPEQGSTYLKARIETYIPKGDAQDALLKEVERTALGKKPKVGLGKLERRVEALIKDQGEEFARLLRRDAELVGVDEGALDGVGALRRLVNAPLKPVLSILEPISPAKVAFLGFDNDAHAVSHRVESFDRYFMALGLDDFTRSNLRGRVAKIVNEQEMYDLTDEVLRLKAAREGVSENIMSAILKEGQTRIKAKQATLVAQIEDGTVDVSDVSDEVYTLAQKGEVVYFPDPEDVKRSIREAKALQGDIPARIRKGIGTVPDMSLFGMKGIITGEDLTVRSMLMKIHRKWKYLTVVPGFEFALAAGTIGYIKADGSVGEKLKQGAAVGAGIGILTTMRYVMRVAGIEEGLRKYLAEGYTPEVWVPHVGRFQTLWGPDLPFRPHNAVRAGDPVATDAQRTLEIVSEGWGALGQTKNPVKKLFRRDNRYLDSYGRIINYQAHPESDAVAEMFLRRQAGELTDDELRQTFDGFVKSDSGKVWMNRHRTAFKGAQTPEEAFARHDTWFRQYFGDPEIARARLDTARSFSVDGVKRDVDVGILKAAQRRNSLPEYIHAENRFRVPKNFKEVALFRDRLTSKFAFEGPTTMLNRSPMAKAVYRDSYNDLVGTGMPRARAQEIAEQEAIARTNRIMFRIDDESRFAAKVDFVFPFQQPREELLRVWAPLITQNKLRTLHMARLAGVAFNNGKESGMFTKDQYGDWRMTVPGSAFLSKTLFNSSAEFDFKLTDLVFFGQGAYNVNFIPSPGGPFWTALSRMAINRWPEGYAGLTGWQKEWLFPYGATGRLFRPEVSRLWQAWTLEPAPFEFASRAEQQDALEKHRRFMFLQLKWQHAKATGDWLWEPSDAELDDAVSNSLKAWAFVGAVTPATPGLLRPDQKALDSIKDQFIKDNGKFDYYQFIAEYPMWEPWLIAGTDTVDDSFERWAETVDTTSKDFFGQNYNKDDTTTHVRRQKKFKDWLQELHDRQAESAAYRERGDIQYAPAYLQQQLYEAWDTKYPKLANASQDNYNRDIELMHIEGTLIGASRDRALDIWRKRYDVSPANYVRLRSLIEDQALRAKFDPWDIARSSEVVFADVQKRLDQTQYKGSFMSQFAAEVRVTSELPVAEQIKYWQQRANNLTYGGDPEETLAQYKAVKDQISGLWRTGPMRLSLKFANKKVTYNTGGDNAADTYRTQIAEAYAQAYELDAQVKALQAKGIYYGGTIDALKKRRKALFDSALSLKNKWYDSIPDITGLVEDIKAVSILSNHGRFDILGDISKYRQEHGFFLDSDEKGKYLDMNSEVRQAYVDDLVNSLNIDPNAYEKGKLFWSWLTDFQRDLLTANLPKGMTDKWAREYPNESGSGGSYKSGGFRGSGNSELNYAYALFKKYSKRTGPAPAAYKEYLALPNDAALRSAFLKKHPEVGTYVSQGPMANMPPSLAAIVQDIMIRNGKWDGEPRDAAAVSEIGFAREMMARWNRRGNQQAPAALQLWIDMPTGQAKADYLKKHPEIGDWLQLGPMANMPESYREVVRDIMFRYGLWTDRQDPLGKTVQGYFSTPSYLKDKYLEDHPELVEYWRITRSPEQKRFYDLADRYFAMTDPNSKRAYLSMHPELQEFFLNQRQKRYESFLNQVAVYMGSNPELFTKYLDRQQDILTELLHKFSSMPMMREQILMRDSVQKDRRASA